MANEDNLEDGIESYASSQWSDNMSFSRESIIESKKKTNNLGSRPLTRPPTGSLPPAKAQPPVKAQTPPSTQSVQSSTKPLTPRREASGELEGYVSEMNDELRKMSSMVGGTVDHIGARISSSIAHFFNSIGDGIRGFFRGILKYFTREIIVGLKTIVSFLDRLLGRTSGAAAPPARPKSTPRPAAPAPTPPGSAPVESASSVAPQPSTAQLAPVPVKPEPYSPPLAAPVSQNVESDPNRPDLLVTFEQLIKKGILFNTIHNKAFIDESSLHDYLGGDGEWQLMEKAITEIRNCAPYARKLPTPKKGPFADKPMQDILTQITIEDFQSFLLFVINRPKPFIEKQLKLSEAYATWAHKGAPTQ